MTVDYATADGTADRGTATTPRRSGTLTFAPGETTQDLHRAVNGDAARRADETFTVDLSGADERHDRATRQGIGTITDDDPRPAWRSTR